MFFFFNDTATTEIYTLSLHDALPICEHRQRLGLQREQRLAKRGVGRVGAVAYHHQTGDGQPGELLAHVRQRSEEHTSELQSLAYLVCRLLLEKKKQQTAIFGTVPKTL